MRNKSCAIPLIATFAAAGSLFTGSAVGAKFISPPVEALERNIDQRAAQLSRLPSQDILVIPNDTCTNLATEFIYGCYQQTYERICRRALQRQPGQLPVTEMRFTPVSLLSRFEMSRPNLRAAESRASRFVASKLSTNVAYCLQTNDPLHGISTKTDLNTPANFMHSSRHPGFRSGVASERFMENGRRISTRTVLSRHDAGTLSPRPENQVDRLEDRLGSVVISYIRQHFSLAPANDAHR